VPPQRLPLWQALLSICNRIDDAVIVHGDRFSRSISWNGNSLGEVRSVGSSLVASAATGVVGDLRDMRDVRRYGDQLLRAFVRHAELDLGNGLAPEEETHSGRSVAASATESDRFSATRPAVTRPAVTRQEVGDRWNSSDGESLRSSLAAARLSPEEYSALGDPASVAGPIAEGSVANNRS